MIVMMVDDPMTLLVRWALLFVVCALPFVFSGIGMLVHHRSGYRRRGSWLPVAAGPWLEERVRALRVGVQVQVHAREGLDAYIPGVATIGLSERTWGGCRPGDWAIAAHELGHAQNMSLHPFVAHLLPSARLGQALLWRGFCAALVCAVLVHEPVLVPLTWSLLVASVAVSSIVCIDELGASWHGHRLLASDQRVRPKDLQIVRASMQSAASVYLLGLLGQVAVLVSWPLLSDLIPPMASAAAAFEPGAAVLWLTVVLIPVLLLRAAHVMLQVAFPEPVTTDFRLFTVMHREGQWEFLTGIGVMFLVVALHPLLPGVGGALALVLATTTAVGPVGGLLATLVIFPVLLIGRRWFESDDRDEEVFFAPPAAPDEAAPALMALYTDPPWYLRVGWLAHLSYLPLLALLLARFVFH